MHFRVFYFIWYSSNFSSVKYVEQSDKEVLNNLIDNVIKSPYRNLCDYCESKGGINKTAFLPLFEKLLKNLFKDFYENPYISEYYLSMPEETSNCEALDFLGKGTEKLDTFRLILAHIKKEKDK